MFVIDKCLGGEVFDTRQTVMTCNNHVAGWWDSHKIRRSSRNLTTIWAKIRDKTDPPPNSTNAELNQEIIMAGSNLAGHGCHHRH